MHRLENPITRHRLKMFLVVVSLVGATIQADCAEAGQGNDITSATAR